MELLDRVMLLCTVFSTAFTIAIATIVFFSRLLRHILATVGLEIVAEYHNEGKYFRKEDNDIDHTVAVVIANDGHDQDYAGNNI